MANGTDSRIDNLLAILDAEEKLKKLNPYDRARLIAAGASFNWSDEGIAVIKSALSDKTYEEALSEERKALESARGKEGSLKYELGGALATGLATAPFTMGTSLTPTIGRVAAVGAAEGLTAGLGGSEGEGVGRFTENPLEVGVSTIAGGALSPLGQKIVTGVSNALNKGLISPISTGSRMLTGKLAKPAEDELIRIINEGQLTIDEVLERIANGEIIPDMSEQAANAVRAVYAKAGEGSQIISDVLHRRADELPEEARIFIRTNLAPNIQEKNILKYMDASEDTLKNDASDAYGQIYADYAGKGSQEIDDAILDAVQRAPKARAALNEMLRVRKLEPFFESVDGQIKLLRNVDLETAENVRRVINDLVTQNYNVGKGTVAGAYKELEQSLRQSINKFAPELADTRAFWSKIEKVSDAFKDGKTIFSKPSDEVEIIFDRLVSLGDQDLLDSFTAGVAQNLANKYELKRGVSTVTKSLADMTSKDRKILEIVYPNDTFEEAIRKIELAARALDTKGAVTRGSQTTITAENVKRMGSTQTLSNLASFVSSGDIFALGRIVKDVFKSQVKDGGLTQDQLTQLSKMLVSEDAELMRKALTDASARRRLIERMNSLIGRLSGGAVAVSAAEGGPAVASVFEPSEAQASDVDQALRRDIKSLAESVSKKGRQKILDSMMMP